jgi:hypothetical protein
MAALRELKILTANKTKLITTARLMLYARSLMSKISLCTVSKNIYLGKIRLFFYFSDGPLFCYDLAINAVI